MAVITPPLFESIDSTYTGASLGLPYADWVREGVLGSGDMLVSERGAGANLSVDVAAGLAWVDGDDSVLQPTYRCYNDATVNLVIAAADPTNPRIDRVIAEVRDAAFAGVSNDWRLRVITGTPAGSPSAPALPNNAISLATVSVPALDTTISNAQITDTRPRAQLGASGGLVPTVTALPASPYDGQQILYEADGTNGIYWHMRYRAASGSAYKWEYLGGPPIYRDDAGASVTMPTTGAFTDFSDALPTGYSLPETGDYLLRYGARLTHSGSGQGVSVAPVATGLAWASANAIAMNQAATTNGTAANVARSVRVTGISGTLKLQYFVGLAGGTAVTRFFEITPIRF